MTDTTRIYRKCGETVMRRIAGETLLIPIRGRLADMQRIFALDSVAERIWESVDGRKDVAQIAGDIAANFDVEAGVAARDAETFLASLQAEGLVATAAQPDAQRAGGGE